jgi:hypothetical protein
MSWRIHINEKNYSDAELLAWNYILPHKHIPVLNSDYTKVKELTCYLEKAFSRQALKSAIKRLGIKRNEPILNPKS